jgi:hypothetical protein
MCQEFSFVYRKNTLTQPHRRQTKENIYMSHPSHPHPNPLPQAALLNK